MSDQAWGPRVPANTDLTYESYLRVADLLSLQHPQSEPAHHDEMLFIIIHQSYELWFKLILHEVGQAQRQMNAGEVLRARHFVHRVYEIMRMLVGQIHILTTMRPVDFLHFRDRLNPASGFQSVQFRELEFLAGLKDERYLRFFETQPKLQERLAGRLEQQTLRDGYYDMLRGQGFDLPSDISRKHLEDHPDDVEQLITAILPIYARPEEHLELSLLTESLVDFDEQLALWREHHVRVVERIIGHKRGTGGSSGVGYLKKTTTKKCFPYLWLVRTRLELAEKDATPW